MRFTVLGSCSGTEPMPGRRHTSTLLEVADRLYMFDAGDSCAYTAHLLGFDVTQIKSVFISHPHIDHVGGLPYLLFLLQKLPWRNGATFSRPFDIYSPSSDVVTGAILLNSLSRNAVSNCIVTHSVDDGLLYDDGILRVYARHNAHLDEARPPYHSYSYLLEVEGKRIIYSGDVKSISELDGWLDADMLMMETGHHDPVKIAEYLYAQAQRPSMLLFVHHGRTMLEDPVGCVERVREILGDSVYAAFDGMQIEL